MRKLLTFLLFLTLAPSLGWAQPGPVPSPFIQSGSSIYPQTSTTCFTFPRAVTGGCMGNGTINAQSVYVNGSPIITEALPSGKIWIGSAGNAATPQTMSGDCTLSVGGAITCSGAAGSIVAGASGTPITGTTNANGLLYNANSNKVTNLASAANGVLVTNGSSVPSISSVLPVPLNGYYDPRAIGAVCNGTDIESYVATLISGGAKNIFIPAGCTYKPASNTLPDDVNFVGEDWFTSIISVATRATDNLLMGARASLNNVGIISLFCDSLVNPTSTNKVCPVGLVRNSSDSNNALTNWVGQGIFMFSGPQMTGPTGAVSTDIPMFAGVSTAPGADINYLAPAASGTSGNRIVTSDGGIGDFILNGWNQTDATLSTGANKGIWLKDYNNGLVSGQYGVRLSRIGNGTLLTLDNIDPDASTSQTGVMLDVVFPASTGGNIINYYHAGTAFSGNVNYMNLAVGSGSCSGNFARYDINSVQKWAVDCSGNATSAGTVSGATVNATSAYNFDGANILTRSGNYTTLWSGSQAAVVIGNSADKTTYYKNDTHLYQSYAGVTIGTLSSAGFVLPNALTYGGVTLSNSVTGTGAMVLGSSPTLTTPTLSGNTFVTDGNYIYTPFNGGSNTGTVRAGLQFDGAGQSVSFYTANTYRGAINSAGGLAWVAGIFATTGTFSSTITTGGYTVATLPGSPGTGARAYVTDQLTTCAGVGAALTGGGAVTCPAFYNGASWVGG